MIEPSLETPARRLPLEAGYPVLRMNFRGAGRSEGVHDNGRGEIEDALTAIEALTERFPGLPVTAVGYSFGAAPALEALAKSLTGPVEMVIIPGASHLFDGHEDRAVDAVVDYIRRESATARSRRWHPDPES